MWMPVGEENPLKRGTKHDPHVTYHADGLYHLATYSKAHHLPRHVRYPFERKRQEPGDIFSGNENMILWGFGREDALLRNHQCDKFDERLVVDAELITPTEYQTIVDDLGEIKSPKRVGLATFQVDLIEPGRLDLRHGLIANPERILVEKLVETTVPWCMITVIDNS